MFFLSLYAIFKNESHILKEWILHYLEEGVEHFYLIDNGSTDDYKPIIEQFKDKIPYYYIDQLEETIIKFIDSNKKIYILNTNDKLVQDYPISESCKQFIRKILTPTPELQKYIDKELSKLQKNNISQIFHIRTNDTIFFTDIDTNTNIEKSQFQYFNTKYLTELKILEK